jgi:hypothetical protein
MRPIPILAALLLAAGASAQTMPPPGFGDSVRHNIEVQAGDMNPEYRGGEVEGGSGVRSAAAVTRYEQGRIIQPKGVTASGAQIEAGASAAPATAAPKGE